MDTDDDGADSQAHPTSHSNKDPHMHQSKPSSGHQAPNIVHNSQTAQQPNSNIHRTRPRPWDWTGSRNCGKNEVKLPASTIYYKLFRSGFEPTKQGNMVWKSQNICQYRQLNWSWYHRVSGESKQAHKRTNRRTKSQQICLEISTRDLCLHEMNLAGMGKIPFRQLEV